MTKIDPQSLRAAFGSFMTGVTVVTSHDADGNPCGFTANSFSSVSLDPPLLSVCIGKSSSNYQTFSTTGKFAVNILSEHQKDISNTFARPSEDRFAGLSWSLGPSGSPVIDEVSAWFDCSMYQVFEAGDHLVLFGQVEAFGTSPAPGLGYARGAYFTPAAEAEVLNQMAELVVSALINNEGRVLLIEDDAGRLSLPSRAVDVGGASAAVEQIISQSGTLAQPGFVYAVVDNEEHKYQYISFLCEAGSDRSTVGSFMELTPDVFERIDDHSTSSMLERFKSERELGLFGVFYGTDSNGRVLNISGQSD